MTPEIQQHPVLPKNLRPIVMIGAGGIVRDGHLPAYRKAGFPVTTIYDIEATRAETTAREFGISKVAQTLSEAIECACPDAVFDLAVPASAHLHVLQQLPEGSSVLIQKPMGETLEQARKIQALCHSKKMVAAVNFQLRYAPYILATCSLIDQGVIGELHDMEVRVTVYMPWQRWGFLEGLPRVEILYHSVHYLDL